MSDTGGEDNPAFSHDDDVGSPVTGTSSTLENSHTESLQQEQHKNNKVTIDQEYKTPVDALPTENGQHKKSFVSQHYVEAARNGSETDNQQYKTETRIELPAENGDAKNGPTSVVKVNGINGNGNNNDASFLNTSATSIQTNDGKKEQIEAVNLELVSMRPYTGNNLQTKGQEACEVPTDPYEEYFVPVNEHRKYIRGEKLYVTKDKRSKSSYWRRAVCWGCVLLVVAIALIIAILAGTGVILTQEATQPLATDEQTSSRPFGDVHAAGSQEYMKNPPSTPPPEVSTSAVWPTTDESIFDIVPEALQGRIFVDNLAWTNDLSDPKSRVYRDVSAEIEENLKKILSPSSMVKVYRITDDGEVSFRASMTPDTTPESMQESMEIKLQENNNMVGKYHLRRLSLKRLINECQYQNMNCEESCVYVHSEGIFACSCLPGRMFDADGKTCVNKNDLSNVNMEEAVSEPSTESIQDIVQGRSRAPDSAFDPRRPGEWMREHSESVTESVDHHTESTVEPKSEPEPSAEPESEPEPTAEPKPEPESTALYELENEPSVEPMPVEPVTVSEPKSEPEPSATSSDADEPTAEQKSVTKISADPPPEPKAEPEPSAEPKSKPESTVVSENESVLPLDNIHSEHSDHDHHFIHESDHGVQLAITTEPSAEPNPEPEPSTEPKSEPEPTAEPKSEPEPSAEPESDHEPSAEPKSEREPTAEPKSEPETSAEPKSQPEPAAGPTSEPGPLSEHDRSLVYDQSSEVKPEATPEPSAEPKSEPEPSAEPKSEPEPSTPVTEPSTQPKSMHGSNDESKLSGESSTEPIAEPKAEPAAEPTAEPTVTSSHADHSIEIQTPPSVLTLSSVEASPSSNEASISNNHSSEDSNSGFALEARSNSKIDSIEAELDTKIHKDSTTSVDLETDNGESTTMSITILPNGDNTAPELKPRESNESNVIGSLPSTVSPKSLENMDESVEPLDEPIKNETSPDDDEHIMLIPVTIEEDGDHNVTHTITTESVPEAVKTNTSAHNDVSPGSTTPRSATEAVSFKTEEPAEGSTVHPLHPEVMPESNVEHSTEGLEATEEKHNEDMSPFLPDIVKEKELSKKAPRLDKDEQDLPNPFEPHVEDVITGHHEGKTNSTASEPAHGLEGTEVTDLSNELHSSNTSQTKVTTEEEDETMEDRMTTMATIFADAPRKISSSKTDTELSVGEPTLTESIDSTNEQESTVNDNGLRGDDATKDDLKAVNTVEQTSNSTEFLEEVKKEMDKPSSDQPKSDLASSVTELVPGVIPLDDEMSVEDTAMPDSMESTTYERPTESFTTQSIPMTTMSPTRQNVENSEYDTTKSDHNVAEDQYNDIGDERVFKDFHGDNEVTIREEVDDKSLKNDFGPSTVPEIEDTTNPMVEQQTTIARSMMETVTLIPETSSSTAANPTTVHASSSSATEMNTSAKPVTTEASPEKRKEDNGTLTTEIPILPIEIQQDILTTEINDVNESTSRTTDNGMLHETTNSEQESVTENSMTMTTQMSSLETKTTAQVPILPDEMQTTESEVSVTKSTTEAIVPSTGESQSKMSSSDVPATTETVSSIELTTRNPLRESDETKINDSTLTIDSTTVSVNKNEASDKMMETNDTESVTTLPGDIKPVSEIIVDVPEPAEFDYKQFFTTTEPPQTTNVPEDSVDDEALSVIPLEEEDDEEMPATVQAVFEGGKETNENMTMTATTESIGRTIPKLTFTDTEGNIVPVPRLKIVEITSASEKPEMTKNKEATSPRTTISTMMGSTVMQVNTTEHPLTHQVRLAPEIIPVYEEIEEDSRDPQMHPTIFMTDRTTPGAIEGEEVNKTSEPLMPTDKEGDLYHPMDISSGAEEIQINVASLTPENITAMPNVMIRDNKTDGISSIKMVDAANEGTVPSVASSIVYSKCTTGQFQCLNGTSRDGAYCVSLSAKCDSEKDCSDGSDEDKCEEEHCQGNFQCQSGQCLRRHLVCNGIKDCGDGSDELNCSQWSCNFDEFKCPSGRCIPDIWRCDGRPDCEDHRDEYSCSESCGNDEYLCLTEKWCIPQTWRCNGVSECANGEDEKLCNCALDQFMCKTGGCVGKLQVCDGIEDCPDRSDEWGCLVANLTIARNETTLEEVGHGELTGSPTLLKIRQSNNERRLVCHDDWTEELSDSYCQSLGFFGAESTQTVAQEEDQKVLRLKTKPERGSNFVSKLDPVEKCESGKVVEISCQEFTCGAHETEGPTARLVGGTPAGEGQWSSVALLKEQKHGVACTASVLGPMHAIASYSCIHRLRQSSSWELFTGRDLQKSTPVKNIIPYPQVKYNQFLYNNDFALIELAEPLEFSRNVSAVCLPTQPFQPRALCVTAGWGFAADGEINLKQYLKFLPIPTYDSQKCNATSHYAGFITKDNICAGYTDTDKGSCYNDEGAPLMCATESGRWVIQGLLSHHSRCSKVHPAIYSSLNPALSWLRNSVPALQTQP